MAWLSKTLKAGRRHSDASRDKDFGFRGRVAGRAGFTISKVDVDGQILGWLAHFVSPFFLLQPRMIFSDKATICHSVRHGPFRLPLRHHGGVPPVTAVDRYGMRKPASTGAHLFPPHLPRTKRRPLRERSLVETRPRTGDKSIRLGIPGQVTLSGRLEVATMRIPLRNEA